MFFPNKSVPHEVFATGTVITGSYVAGNVFSVDEQNVLGILVRYTKGNESSLELKVESGVPVDADGTIAYGQQVAETATGGSIAVALAERTFTASGNYWVLISPIKSYKIKISAKATGGGPTGTYSVHAITGWV
ncbi:hypothetical protein KW807_02555 [Candidatus Parcubacteria bacterium]|nr:hypothetical protein [Candidatus Parcubacteria bacterium]